MGVTGCGKTTFISKLCPHAATDIGHALQSRTLYFALSALVLPFSITRRSGSPANLAINANSSPETSAITAYSFMLGQTKAHLIDTPGFNYTYCSDAAVLTEITVWLSASYRQSFKIDSIPYLHRISDRRLTGSSLKNLHILRKLCVSNNLSSVALVATMKDSSDTDMATATARETELVSNSAFGGLMIEFGGRSYRHLGTRESAMQIVSSMTSSNTTTVLQIQRELAIEGKTLLETSAGRELNAELDMLHRKHETEIREHRRETSRLEAELAEKEQKI